MASFLLINSPLVGAMTWTLVADELRRGGHRALAPSLFAAPNPSLPYWQQHAQAAAAEPFGRPPILVAHSGAGPLLPAIRQAMNQPAAGYIFADAGLPKDGLSRLDQFDTPEEAEAFRGAAVDGLLPTWTADDLREVIPDDAIRQQFAAELRPLPLAVYEEPLPVFAGWPDAPCAYLQFSPVYDAPAREAQAAGWAYQKLPGGHFHLLVDASAVAAALIDLAHRMEA